MINLFRKESKRNENRKVKTFELVNGEDICLDFGLWFKKEG